MRGSRRRQPRRRRCRSGSCSAILAWSMEADTDAETAYQHVWAAGAGNAEIAERLATLLAASGRADELARLAAEAFQKFGAASVLLTGMDAAIEAERWDAARTLARIAAPRRAELADEPSYWSAARPAGRARRKADRGGRRVREGGGAGATRRRARRGPARRAHRARPRPRSRRLADAHDRAAEAASARLATAIDRHDRRDGAEILTTRDRAFDPERPRRRGARARPRRLGLGLLARAPRTRATPTRTPASPCCATSWRKTARAARPSPAGTRICQGWHCSARMVGST